MATLLSNARKYITLDQLLVFHIYYECVVTKGQTNAQACDAVREIDTRRDASAVKKVIQGLNNRFDVLFQKPLIEKEQDGTFRATEIGKEVYEFSRRIADTTSELERRLSAFLPGAMSMHCWIRSDLVKLRTKWLRELRSELADQIEIQVHALQTGNMFDAMRSNSSTFAIDQLFVTDKRNINSNDLYYYPIASHSIVAGVTPNYDSLLGKANLEDGVRTIDVADIASANLIFTRNAFQFRAALALANLAVMPKDFIDADVIDDVRSYFPNSKIEGEAFSDLAFSSFIDRPHAIIGDAELIREANGQLGQDYEIIPLTSKGVEQYFHEAVIVHREAQAALPGTGAAQLMEFFGAARDEFYRHGKKRVRPEWSARVKSNEADYEKAFFRCSGCGERVYYDDETFPLISECRHCLRVQKFDPTETDQDRIVVTYRDVRDIDSSLKLPSPEDTELFEEPIHCTREGCGNILDEEEYYTAKGNPYRFCSTCHTVFQSADAVPETVEFDCPTSAASCGKPHRVRVSSVKPVAEFYCYNSGRLVEYNNETGIAVDKTKLDIKEVALNDPKMVNTFRCPHFGCGVTAKRRLVYNVTGEAYSHCRACNNEIRILPLESEKDEK